MLLKEGTLTIREARFIIEESKALILSAKEALKKINGMLNTVHGTIDKVSKYIIQPFSMISGFFNKVKEKVSGVSGMGEKPEYYSEDESPIDDSQE